MKIDDSKVNATAIKVLISALAAVAAHALSGGAIEPLWAGVTGVAVMSLLSVQQIVDGIQRIMFSLEAVFASEKETQAQLQAMKDSLEMKLLEAVKKAVDEAALSTSLEINKVHSSLEEVSRIVKEQSVLELPTLEELKALLAQKAEIETETEDKPSKSVKFDFSQIHAINKKTKKKK